MMSSARLTLGGSEHTGKEFENKHVLNRGMGIDRMIGDSPLHHQHHLHTPNITFLFLGSGHSPGSLGRKRPNGRRESGVSDSGNPQQPPQGVQLPRVLHQSLEQPRGVVVDLLLLLVSHATDADGTARAGTRGCSFIPVASNPSGAGGGRSNGGLDVTGRYDQATDTAITIPLLWGLLGLPKGR